MRKTGHHRFSVGFCKI
jgi:hypothetical protein